jgi:hypothetical protein
MITRLKDKLSSVWFTGPTVPQQSGDTQIKGRTQVRRRRGDSNSLLVWCARLCINERRNMIG